VRTINKSFTTVRPSMAVPQSCPTPASAAPTPRTVVSAAPPVIAAPQGTTVLARQLAPAGATGVGNGYAAWLGTAKRRGVERDLANGAIDGKSFISTNGKQQDQLHLMSRRDPRSWRPPA
jgi:hypothetical protein